MCVQCEENEWKLLVDRQTAAKQYALLSCKGGGGGIKMKVHVYNIQILLKEKFVRKKIPVKHLILRIFDSSLSIFTT
jgi:hypothetical protein